jgi:hypothetical protein
MLLFEQHVFLMMDRACPIWRSAARNHVRTRQVLQSKLLCIAFNAAWYTGNRQIREDVRIPYFADHIGSLTVIFRLQVS